MTDNEPHFDGREMLILHDMFRREFALMPGLVRGVAAGDRERAQVIAAHITYVSTILHHRHHGKDVTSSYCWWSAAPGNALRWSS
jgi:hypothetical protein